MTDTPWKFEALEKLQAEIAALKAEVVELKERIAAVGDKIESWYRGDDSNKTGEAIIHDIRHILSSPDNPPKPSGEEGEADAK